MQYAFLSHVLDSTKECYKDKRIIPEKNQTHFSKLYNWRKKILESTCLLILPDSILAGPKVNLKT